MAEPGVTAPDPGPGIPEMVGPCVPGARTPDQTGAYLHAHGVDFAVFYRSEVRPLVGFLMMQGAGVADAADLAQESMVEAFRRWVTIRHPRAWVRRVATRAYIRRATAIQEQPTCDVPEPSLLLRPQADIAVWEQRQEVLRALAALPQRQRQIMAWIYDGFTPQEIAEELGLTAEAVRASALKARRALAKNLQFDGEGDHRDES